MLTYINTLGRVAAKAHEQGYRISDYDAAARKNWENCSSLSFPGSLARLSRALEPPFPLVLHQDGRSRTPLTRSIKKRSRARAEKQSEF